VQEQRGVSYTRHVILGAFINELVRFKKKFPGEVDPILIYNHEDGGAPLIIYSARNGSFEAVQ
jgi:hypothetical protein